MTEYYVVHYGNGYLAYDNHSGGYPYAANFGSANKFSKLEDAIRVSNTERNCSGVSRCTISITQVTESEAKTALRASALAKLTAEEIAALGIKE